MLVSIDQCYFRGTKFAIAKARKALEQSRFPAVGDAEYIILRELKVKAEISQLGQQYYQQSENVISTRVYGWSESAVSADCIWFASETDLYACLCRDIANGRAASLWFWKSFSSLIGFSNADSLTAVLRQQARQLPNLIQRLYEQRELSAVWSAISEPAAESLALLAVDQAVQKTIRNAAILAFQSDNRMADLELPTLLSVLLKGLKMQTSALSAKQELAVVIYLQIAKPHWLFSSTSAHMIRRLVQQVHNICNSIMSDSKARASNASAIKVVPSSGTSKQIQTDVLKTTNRQLDESLVSSITQTSTAKDDTPLSVVHLSAQNASDSNISANTPMPDMPAQQNSFTNDDTEQERPADYPACEEWQIAQGGLFYLLNVLNQPVIRQQLLIDEQAIAFPSGWGWLYRLGEAFGLRHERELLRCLSALSGLDEETFLTTTPELEAASDILTYARQRYQRYGCWNPQLLNKPAHIAYTRPELSITFSVQDVDIDLRRSGLDIDPVWIDWLATVVRFHYREAV